MIYCVAALSHSVYSLNWGNPNCALTLVIFVTGPVT